MGTPPEDESGATEDGAPSAGEPPKSERVSALAARIDAFMADDDDDDGEDDRREGSEGEGRASSAREGSGEIRVASAEPQPRHPESAAAIEVNLDADRPRASEGSIEVKLDESNTVPRISEPSIEINLDGDRPAASGGALESKPASEVAPRVSEPSIEINLDESTPVARVSEPVISTTGSASEQNDEEVEVDADAVEEISESDSSADEPAPAGRPPMPPPRPPGAPPPPPPRIAIPTPKLPPIRPPAIPPPRQTAPGMPSLAPPPSLARPRAASDAPALPRTKTDDRSPPPPPPSRTQTSERPALARTSTSERPPLSPTGDDPASSARTRRASTPAEAGPLSVDDVLGTTTDLAAMDGGVEVGTATPNVVVDQPLEADLDAPTVVDRAIAALGESGVEARASAMEKDLDDKVVSDPAAAALVAYELGELCERRLADESRAIKAFDRALNLDPSLRSNLWAIRRVFYRRSLWPNVQKLVDAELPHARDDYERADLLLEKARISSHRANDPAEAREALDEAVRIAPHHLGVLLELERVSARTGDVPALLDVWERLADAVSQPVRKVSYLLEVARTAGAAGEIARAYAALDRADELTSALNTTTNVRAESALAIGERIARERLRIADDHGTPEDAALALDRLAAALLATFGPAGPGAEPGLTAAGERPTRAASLRLELVALLRRQAQLAHDRQPERAWEALQQALALSPGEAIVLADLTELAEELGRYEELAELVQNWQSVEDDPARAMTLSIRRADALLRGGQHEQARALIASLEATAPGFVVLTSAAERDALGRKDAGALAATYLAGAHAALLGTWVGPGQSPRPDPQAAATLYVQGAELLAYEVGTPEALDEARAALGKALEAVPSHPAALEAMTELDDLTGRLVEALARLAAATHASEGDERHAILERAVRLARSHGDLEALVGLQREIVEAASSDVSARWRLEATLAQLGRDEERADLLVQIAADEADASGRGTALSAAARLRERAGAVEAATELYRQVLALWPEDAFARESLIDLLRAQERWQDLVAERRSEATALPDGAAARRALREAAWVLEVKLGDPAQAASVYDEWLVRMPDDRAALEGLARCRALAGDRAGEAAARGALAETEPGTNTTWLHARALERAGQPDEAAELYRALIANEEPSTAAIAAALALGDIAAARGDTVMRVEATAALAGRTGDPRFGAALAEDSGWMYALVLEDADRAAQSFEAAIALDPTRRGAHLGAALVAARRADALQLALAYEGLAAATEMPEAAAALLMRGAAMAAAAGDLELANQRMTSARGAAPDETGALLVVAETATLPQTDPKGEAADAQAVVDPLLARAEVLEMRSALADDAAARASWELDRAEALELAGRLREAGAVVAAVLKTRPDDVRALAALRRMAARAGDKASAASAAYSLARVIGDRQARLELLREAVVVFDGTGLARNSDYAIAAYRRILLNDPGAIELERLLELLRERGDVRTLVHTISERLGYHEAENHPNELMVPLLLERATVLHGLGETEAAIADLDVLLDRAPKHVEALRFRADLAFNTGDVDGAVALWRRYLVAETRPNRRGEIELQLAQVLAENTNDIGGAIEQLERVVDANPDDAQLRERLLGLCLRASDWERAVRELRALARMRPTPQEKAREELRLGLMLRDRIGDRTSARMALDRARTLDALNLDVVRELADLLEPAGRAQMLDISAQNLREAIVQTPSKGALYEKLAQVNAWQADVDARWLSLVAVEALGTPSVDQKQVLAQGRQKQVAPTRVKLDDAARRLLRGELGGALHDLWRTIAPAVQVAIGVDVGKLGFARGDRIAQKKLGDKYEPLATALACFGVDDVDIYINAGRTGFARALAAETPILCLGADVANASTANQRFLLGRSVATLAEGVASLGELREGELEWTIAAALKAVEAPVPAGLQELIAGEDAGIAERAKVLKKELGRKARALVAQIAQTKGGELAEVAHFRKHALAVRQRAGLVWAGDLAVAFAILDVGRGGRSLADSPTALELAAWSVSSQHLQLRSKLQLALKGAR